MSRPLPRGIAPDLLLSQVRNTMPYLFESSAAETPLGLAPPARVLRDYFAAVGDAGRGVDSGPELTHFEYFRLCVCSHYLSCATPVPTDVDNQIRLKLWPKELPFEDALEMTEFVLASRAWDFTLLSTRFARGARGSRWEGEALPGHLGEWFTIAAAAYCALGRYSDSAEACALRARVYEQIAAELERHAEIFGSLWKANDGLSALKASASIAHNLGDLDRVMDMWELGAGDPLRIRFYKLAAVPFDAEKKLRYGGRLWVAGELYKAEIAASSMAFENHRHFALRKPRCLRRSPALLIPIGPFFDDWGRAVARHLAGPDGAPSADTLEVVEALRHGWERLPRTVGYGRALRGITEVHPELKLVELRQKHSCRWVLEQPQADFEKTWANGAVAELDDIPSRAK